MIKKNSEVADEIADELDGIVSAEEEEGKEEGKENAVSDDDFLPKTDDDDGEDGEKTSETPEEDVPSEKDDGEEETEGLDDELSLDDFDEEESTEKKSGVQKRIDQLTSRLKTLEEENTSLKNSTPKEKTTEYSESQLKTALGKAMEEGDSNLMWEIMDYRINKAEKQAVTKYQKQDSDVVDKQKRHQQEWISIVEEYDYLSDKKEPEMYRGSHKELNLSDTTSTAFKLATKLYTDPDRAERYLKDGGQRLAVSDAVRMILRKRKTKVESTETKKLKRQLVKEKKKSTVSSGKAVKSETTTPITRKSSLEDYLNERKEDKTKIAGGI